MPKRKEKWELVKKAEMFRFLIWLRKGRRIRVRHAQAALGGTATTTIMEVVQRPLWDHDAAGKWNRVTIAARCEGRHADRGVVELVLHRERDGYAGPVLKVRGEEDHASSEDLEGLWSVHVGYFDSRSAIEQRGFNILRAVRRVDRRA